MKPIPLVLLLASVSLAQAPLAPAEDAKIPDTNSRVGALEFTPDGKALIASIEGEHGVAEIHVIDAGTRKRRFIAAMPEEGYIYRHGMSPDGSTLVTIAGSRLAAWDAATGKMRFHKEAEVFAFPADGKTLVAGSWHDKWVALCDPVSGAERRRFEMPVGVITAMALEGGKLVALAQNGGQGIVMTWDAESGKELVRKEGLGCQFWNVVKDSKGGLQAWGYTRKGVELWDLADVKPVRSWTAQPAAIAWTATGDRVAITEGDAVFFLDAGSDTPVEFTGKRKAIAPEPEPVPDPNAIPEDRSGRRAAVIPDVTGLEFSPDGRFLAFAHSNAVVSVWNVASRTLEARLATAGKPESARFCRVAWSPDGTKLATSADSAGIVLWDRDAAITGWKK